MPRVVDSHCHLELDRFGPDEAARDEVIDRARAAGVAHFVTVGSGDSLASVENALHLVERHADFSAAVALHPHDARLLDEETFARIAEAARHPRVVAVGETGLDYHYMHSPPEAQQGAFRRFIGLARDLGKPLVLHVREAHEDARRILREERAFGQPVVVHCFTGTLADARAYLDLGCVLSFSGVVTFKTAEEIRQAVAITPLDRLLVETDCPYLAPVPHRGQRNEPAFVVETLRAVAAVRGLPLEEMAAASLNATRAAFRLDIPGSGG